MMAAADFTVRWRVVSNALPAIIVGMEPLAAQIVRKAALDISAHAKRNAPVDTGTLRNSIQARKIAEGHYRVTVGAEYGVHVEWGTVHMGAQPFLRPAITAVQPSFMAAMRKVVVP